MTDPVDRLNRTLEGRYAIERKLGEGGMATVYLARDVRHERQVALKVLKPDLAAVVGAERFLTEIKVTAGLQHPNILPLFDSGEADGFLFYVMPYVEGESLRERLDRERQLPVEEAVRIATAVAGALQAAHDRGVVHRDIKPANILLSAGQPLVADFGIALAVRAGGGARLTETGLSLGTPYYMSPEQATGDQQVGARSDIYSLGCVLYEMLVGEPPYTGSTAQAVLGQIISGRPVAPTEKRSTLPANVDATIRKALEKVAADRFATAIDFAAALDNPAFRYGDAAAAIQAGAVRKWKAVAAVLAVVSIASLSFGVWGRSSGADGGGEVHRHMLASPTPDPADVIAVRMSPDGSMTAFILTDPDTTRAGEEDGRAIWVQRRDQLTPTLVQGTEGSHALDFSPDGMQLAFMVDSTLQTIPVAGGVARTLTNLPGSGGLAWASDGYIYRALSSSGRGAVRVPENGGVSQPLSLPDSFSSVFGTP
jgi:serine/threonine protein kinase